MRRLGMLFLLLCIVATAAAGEWLARTLPHATFARIDGAAHAPFLSHRGAFDRALDGFLDAR